MDLSFSIAMILNSNFEAKCCASWYRGAMMLMCLVPHCANRWPTEIQQVINVRGDRVSSCEPGTHTAVKLGWLNREKGKCPRRRRRWCQKARRITRTFSPVCDGTREVKRTRPGGRRRYSTWWIRSDVQRAGCGALGKGLVGFGRDRPVVAKGKKPM